MAEGIEDVAGTFEQACAAAHTAFRDAIVDAYESVGADPTNPQEASRRFGLNKNLTWKIWKLVDTGSPFEALTHLPGHSGITILIDGLERHGARPEALAQIRQACDQFEAAVSTHVGDRASLELVLDGLVAGGQSRLELSRKLAFRGFSGVLGVQAQTKLTIGILAPSWSNPARVDVTMIRGILGFRHLRPGVEWPLFRIQSYGTIDPETVHPRGPELSLGPKWSLLAPYCSASMPDLLRREANGGIDLVLPAGPVGNTGLIDCVFATQLNALGDRYRSEAEAHGDLFTAITLPVERMVFDLMFHRDMLPTAAPRVMVLSRPLTGPPPEEAIKHNTLPIDARMRSIGSARSVRLGVYERYPDLLLDVLRSIGRDTADFVTYRLEIDMPPVTSTVVLRYDLPGKPVRQ